MLSRPLLLAPLLALATLVGCQRSREAEKVEEPTPAPSKPAPKAEEPARTPPRASQNLLVWAREPSGETMSFRIDDEGKVVERFEGIRLEVDGKEWQWQEQRITAARDTEGDCGEREGSRGEGLEDGDENFMTRASVVRLDESEAQTIVSPPTLEEGIADYEHIVKLIRSLGPLLFVREATYSYSCGAHGNEGATATIWDIRENGPISLESEIASVDDLHARAERILGESEDAFVTEEEDVTLSELLPSYGKAGELELNLRFTGFTCYACSDGEWSSYTKSILLPTPKLPETLLPYAKLPPSVIAFLGEHPELELGGVSALDISVNGPAPSKSP